MIVVLDIETDSLDASVVHCIVAKDRQTGEVHSWREQECYTDFPLFCSKVDKFIMHNGISLMLQYLISYWVLRYLYLR